MSTARDDESPHFCINQSKNIDNDYIVILMSIETISSINYDNNK